MLTSTWVPARLPEPADVVSIGHTVTYDSTTGDATVIGVDAGGVLQILDRRIHGLRVGTFLVLPGGALEIGTATAPGAICNYPSHRMLVDGLVYRVDRGATQCWPSAYQCSDYWSVDVTIKNGSIHAGGMFGGCIDPLGTHQPMAQPAAADDRDVPQHREETYRPMIGTTL